MTLPISRHRILNLVADAVLIAVAWRLTFWIRFDQTIPPFYKHLLSWQTFAIVLGIKLSIFVLFGFYNRWWRYVSTRDMWGAPPGVTLASVIASVIVYFASPVQQIRLPRSVAIMDWLLLLAFVAGSRLLARTVLERPPARGLMA